MNIVRLTLAVVVIWGLPPVTRSEGEEASVSMHICGDCRSDPDTATTEYLNSSLAADLVLVAEFVVV